MSRALVLALLGLMLLAVAPTGALDAKPRPTLYEVEKELMCDTCDVPLNIAASERADQERKQIQTLIAQGKTKQEILDIFVEQYGPNVLAVPRGGGASITVWAVPAGILAAVVLGLLLLLPRWRRRQNERPPDDGTQGPAVSSADAQRLEQDLAAYDL